LKPRYRELIAPEIALARLLERLGPPGSLPAERLPSEQAVGRVSAEPVFAGLSSPPYHAAAMDGIAVRAEDTRGAAPTAPLGLAAPGQAREVDTGDPMPAGFDAVIPVEALQEVPGGFEIRQAAAPGQHVRLKGEDVVAGELLLARGRRISPAHLAALLSTQVLEVSVRRRPRVAILPTGDELCEPGEDPSDGRVIDSNSRMLAAQVLAWGGQPERLAPERDDPERLRARLDQALEAGADVVLVLAGSSAGRGDFTPRVLAEAGELLFHGLTLMPGKPTAAGLVRGRPVLGVPGFPVSAAVAADRLLRPLLEHLVGVPTEEPPGLQARLLRGLPSRPGLEEVLRVVVGRFPEGWVVAPLGRGAGSIAGLSRAHGLVRVPAALEGLEAGSQVEVELLRPRAELEAGLLFAGSHDLALALLDDALGAARPGAGLSVAPLGSLGGLGALARGEAHLAGCHLLDAESGEYNLTQVRAVLGARPVRLVTLAHREQGLAFRPGEPTASSFAEIATRGLRFANRQGGSGTRLLTDHHLARAGLSPEAIRGYPHEEHTHMAAAEAVRSGLADCALVIRAAARALGLEFVPLDEERYDLVIPRESLADPRIMRLLEVLTSPAYRARVTALGGYSTRETGRAREPS
jgi:putative molybdopterin biosynthesis protein